MLRSQEWENENSVGGITRRHSSSEDARCSERGTWIMKHKPTQRRSGGPAVDCNNVTIAWYLILYLAPPRHQERTTWQFSSIKSV